MQAQLLRILKVFLSVGLIFVIFRYFFHFENLPEVWTQIGQMPICVFVIATISALVNWGIESKKWQILVRQLEHFSFSQAVKSTCSGAAVSNILPFRIGEYLGRIVYLKPDNRIPAAFNSVLGSTTQFIVSIAFGIPAVGIVLDAKYQQLAIYALITLAIILLIFYIAFRYFFTHTKFKFIWLEKLSTDIRNFTTSQIVNVFVLSLLRYFVFSSFYVFLLIYFNISNDVLLTYAGVASIYFLQSFAPSMILTDAGLRTALPLLVFHPNATLEAKLLAAALINYFFNILLPSILGLLFIVTKKIRAS